MHYLKLKNWLKYSPHRVLWYPITKSVYPLCYKKNDELKEHIVLKKNSFALKWLELIAVKINSWIFSCCVTPAGTYFLSYVLLRSIYKYLVVQLLITDSLLQQRVIYINIKQFKKLFNYRIIVLIYVNSFFIIFSFAFLFRQVI